MAELNARDGKLVQYLNEAYGKEKELETGLQAHIEMTTSAPYKKRLREHLAETKRHARSLEKRVKQLGGTPQTVPIEGLDPLAKGAGAAVELAGRAAAAVKGPLQAIRGTGEQEKMLKNAKSEYSDEHEEIATYTAIETLATALGDTETAKLARTIRREEQRMAAFLARQIPTLTKAVIQAEIPPALRRKPRAGGKPAKRRSASATRAKAPAETRAKSAAKTSARSAGKASTRAASKKRAKAAGKARSARS